MPVKAGDLYKRIFCFHFSFKSIHLIHVDAFMITCEIKQIVLLYLPTQTRFPIGGKSVTCRGSKLTNLPGKQQLEQK